MTFKSPSGLISSLDAAALAVAVPPAV